MKWTSYLFIVPTFLILVLSCDKSTFVGSDLFLPESIDLLYKDDFNIIARTVRVDSVRTTDGFVFTNYLLNGVLTDPIFGTTVAETYIDLHIGEVDPGFRYFQSGEDRFVTLDSAVLVLGLSPERAYGDTLARHTVAVQILLEEIPARENLYSNFQPPFSDDRGALAETEILPNAADTLEVIEPGDTTNYTGMLRIPMNPPLFNAMIFDTATVSSDQNFVNFIPGIRIKSIPENGNAIWAIDRSKTAQSPFNSIIMYYTKEGVPGSFRIFVDGERHNYFYHDYTGSVVGSFLDDPVKGDSLLFLQGMSGTDIEIDIPELADPSFGDFLINRAALEFYVLEQEGDSLNLPIDQIMVRRYDEDNNLVVVEDAFLATEVLSSAAFKGNLEEIEEDGVVIKKYTAILSVHTLRMFSQEISDTRLVISARDKIETPKRSVIFGPGHSTYPMKFKLIYSK